jgi:hypothetical protein
MPVSTIVLCGVPWVQMSCPTIEPVSLPGLFGSGLEKPKPSIHVWKTACPASLLLVYSSEIVGYNKLGGGEAPGLPFRRFH